jgi:hypothetical protein
MSYVTNEGYELWYETTGSGRPILLSGGFGLVDSQFERVTPLLAEHFRVTNWN